MLEQLDPLLRLAKQAALEAGAVIRSHFRQGVKVSRKAAGESIASQVVTEVDHKAQAVILQRLARSCETHNLAMLSEELADNRERFTKPAFWCIDPLDGTLAFVRGVSGFSVSIALVSRDGTPLIGVVYDPLEERLYHAVNGGGCYLEGQAIAVPAINPEMPLVLRTDHSFATHPWLEQTARGLDGIARIMGLPGAGVEYHIGGVTNVCGILENANICYFKYPRVGESGGSVWDFAASSCLLQSGGGVAVDMFGDPLALNRKESTFMNHRGVLFCGDRALARHILDIYPVMTA